MIFLYDLEGYIADPSTARSMDDVDVDLDVDVDVYVHQVDT